MLYSLLADASEENAVSKKTAKNIPNNWEVCVKLTITKRQKVRNLSFWKMYPITSTDLKACGSKVTHIMIHEILIQKCQIFMTLAGKLSFLNITAIFHLK